jgi:hypothetical protein
MVDRLKRALVESFVGAIALGYLLAEVVLYFVRVFTSPVTVWAERNLFRGLVPGTTSFSDPPLRAVASPATGFVILLLVWYLLVRWLYFTPLKEERPEPNPEQAS